MGTIKHRYGKDLTEAEDIKKIWYTYTMEYYSAIKKNTFSSNEVDETETGRVK